MRDCEEVKEAVKHKKKLPECKQVTKNNCLTDWNVDENGNKVWAGTESCTPVTWEECAIVEKEVDFPTVRTQCDVRSSWKSPAILKPTWTASRSLSTSLHSRRSTSRSA